MDIPDLAGVCRVLWYAEGGKSKGTIDGHDFQTSFLPWGDGTHMMPIKAPILKALKKQAGDEVEVILIEKV